MLRWAALALIGLVAAACTRTVYVPRTSTSPSPVVVTSPSPVITPADHQPPRGDWWCFLDSNTRRLSCGNDQLFLGDIPLGKGGVLYRMGPCSFQDISRLEAGLSGEGYVTIWGCDGTIERAE
jgi:hypothetical protein